MKLRKTTFAEVLDKGFTVENIITSKNVHLSYGNVEALHGISLDFEEKELTALSVLQDAENQPFFVV